MTRVAWPQLMKLGFTRLGLTPGVFWSLTPAELMLLAGMDSSDEPLSRQGFAALAERFPDNPRPDRGDLE